jgi:hypothetical protein
MPPTSSTYSTPGPEKAEDSQSMTTTPPTDKQPIDRRLHSCAHRVEEGDM